MCTLPCPLTLKNHRRGLCLIWMINPRQGKIPGQQIKTVLLGLGYYQFPQIQAWYTC